MKKISTIFVRDFSKRPCLVTTEVTPGCEWVFEGRGVATRKWDGTCVLIREGKMYARYDCKKGRTPPEGFEPCEEAPDPNTGHWPGWILVEGQTQYKWHRQALEFCIRVDGSMVKDGTYELLGPKVNGNPENVPAPDSGFPADKHILVRHGYPGTLPFPQVKDRSFNGLKLLFIELPPFEGIVFHHEDGRMAKIKRSDFGLPWPVKDEQKAKAADSG